MHEALNAWMELITKVWFLVHGWMKCDIVNEIIFLMNF